MTSMISPWLHATQMATKAQDSLHTATATLNGPRPMRGEKPGLTIGIPEHNGPDTPDNPWFLDESGRERGIYGVAAGHAREAVASIDSALSYGSSFLSRDIVNAFTRAKEQARAGALQLTAKTTMPINVDTVALQFDGASLWLGLAKNLIQLHDGRPSRPLPPVKPVMPPVTILPVDPPVGPGEPGSPITIQPIMPGHPAPTVPTLPTEPITIQLPSPDSPIQ